MLKQARKNLKKTSLENVSFEEDSGKELAFPVRKTLIKILDRSTQEKCFLTPFRPLEISLLLGTVFQNNLSFLSIKDLWRFA